MVSLKIKTRTQKKVSYKDFANLGDSSAGVAAMRRAVREADLMQQRTLKKAKRIKD